MENLIVKIFLGKTNTFKSNDISKTQKFYDFILMVTEFVQISHIKNNELRYKHRIFKIQNFENYFKNDWG